MKKEFIVIAHCADGDVIIKNENRENPTTIEEANEIRNAHLSICENIEIVDSNKWNISVCPYDNGKTIELTIRATRQNEELETIIEVDHDTPTEDVYKLIQQETLNLLNPKTYHIKGYMDMTSQIEVNFGENKFNSLKEAYLAAKENLEYCVMEITEPSTGLRILLTTNELEIWNEKPKVHFKQPRPTLYKDLEKIINEIFLS